MTKTAAWMLAAVILVGVFAAPARAAEGPCTVSWAGDQSGDWSVASNWSPARVPTYQDDACIDRGAADPTVTISADADVRSLHSAEHLVLSGGQAYLRGASDVTGAALDVSGGTLNVADALSLTGTVTWTGGSITGGTATSSGTFVAAAEATLGLALTNTGTLRVDTAGALSITRTLTNTGTIDLHGDGDIAGGGVLVQNGMLKKTAGTGISVLGSLTDNCCISLNGASPTFDAQTGTIQIAAPGEWTGGATLNTATGATIRFANPTNPKNLYVAGTLKGTGTGTVENGNFQIADDDGTFPLNVSFPAGMLKLAGGTLGGSGAGITNTGAITVTGPSSMLSVTNAAAGTVTQQADLGWAGGMHNLGLWEIAGASALSANNNGSFANDGTIRKTGAGTATLNGSYTSAGQTFDVRAGTLETGAGIAWTGGTQFTVATGAAFRFHRDGGDWSYRVSGTLTGSGGGTVELADGELDVLYDTTLNFPAGMLRLTGGAFWGGNATTNHGSMTIAATASLLGITNASDGTVTQSAAVGFGGTMINQGLWDITGDYALTQNNNGSFTNNATVRKSAGTGAATFDGNWYGAGQTVDVRTGTLTTPASIGWTGGAQLKVATGATLQFHRADSCCWSVDVAGAITGSGGGTVELDDGILYASDTTTLNFPAGMFFVKGGTVDGRTYMTNHGTVAVTGAATFYNLTNAADGVVLQQAAVGTGGAVINQGRWDIAGDVSLFQANNGGFVNNATLRKTAGTGVALIEGNFDGTGQTLEAQTGTIQLATPSTWSGTTSLVAASGAKLVFHGTTDRNVQIRVSGALSGTGAGRVEFDDGELYTNGGTPATLNFAPGLLHVVGGTLSSLDNLGDLTVDSGGAALATFLNTRTGTITESGSGAITYLGNVTNAGLLTLANDNGLVAGANSTLYNTGMLRRSGSSGVANLVDNFSNTGTVDVRTGKLNLGRPAQLSGYNGSTLTAGTWLVSGTGVLSFPQTFGITSNDATIGISGPDADFPELHLGPAGSLKTNTGSLTLGGGAALHLEGDLANSGTIALGRASRLNVDGTFTQTAPGTLAVTVDGRPSAGAFGALQAGGAAALDGTLAVSTGSNFAAVTDDRFPVLRYASQTGAFAQTTGLPLSGAIAFVPQLGADALTLRVGALGSTRAALTASDVTSTAAVPGDDVTVGYTVANRGDATTAGTWNDSLYLSADGAYDADDVLIGRVSHSGDLAHDGSYAGSLTAPLPGVVPGSYRVLVVPDSRGANPSNAPGAGAGASAPRDIDLPVLTPGTPVSGTVVADRYYRLAPGTTGDIQVDGSGPVEFLVRTGALPDANSTDTRSGARVLVPDPGADTVYIAVHGAGAFTLRAGPVTFAVGSVTPATAGVGGSSTLTITGGGFGADTTAALVDGGGSVVATAAHVTVGSGSTLYATFDLTRVAAGTYGVRVTSGARSATLPAGLQVTAGAAPGRLEIDTPAPDWFRIGFPAFFTVTYRNTGDSDVKIPLVKVTADRASVEILDGTHSAALDGLAAGFIPTVTGAPPGVIPPGGSGSVQVKFFGHVAPHEYVHFKTEVVEPDDIAIDWASRKAGLKPAQLSSAAWDKIWPTFLSEVGSTNATYLAALSAEATRAANTGRSLPLETDLLGALRERAIAEAPGAPVHGTLTVAGQPGAGKTLTAFDDAGRGGTVRTDDDGAFSIWDIPAGTYTLSLRGREQDPWGTVVVPQAGALNVDLPGAAQITGIVQDTGGAPIAGARVTGSSPGHVSVDSTDSRGHFTLDQVAPGTVKVAVAPPHATAPAPQSVTLTGSDETTPLTFTVGAGSAVQGTITKPDGSAAVGATVVAGSEQTTTDGFGAYTLDSLVAGDYRVSASLAGFGTVTRSITLAANGSAAADLRLDAAGEIAGTVSSGGAPVAGATVSLTDAGGRPQPVKTAADGTFTVSDLGAGEHTLVVAASDLASSTQTVTLAAGEHKALDVTLTTSGKLSGSVLGAGDAPLAGVAVTLGSELAPAVTATTDATGGFVFTGLPAGHYAVALDAGLSVARRDVDLAAGASSTLTLHAAASTLSGTTLAADGSAAGKVPVALMRGGETLDSGISDSAGQFSFRVTDAGTYKVVGSSSTFGIGTSTGTAISGVDVRAGAASLTLRVLDHAGASAADAAVTLTDASGTTLRSASGANGTVRFTGLPAGSYSAAATVGGDVVTGQTVAAPGTVDLHAAAGTTIRGTVTDSTGHGIALATVLATDTGGTTRTTVTAADGTYAVNVLPVGEYTLSIADGTHRTVERTVATTSAASPTTIDVALATTTTPVTVTAQDADGTTLSGVQALLAVQDGARYVPAHSSGSRGLQGKIALGGLDASQSYRLTLFAPGRPRTRVTFTTDASGAPVDLPARVTLAALQALPGAVAAAPSAKRAASAAASARRDFSVVENFKDTLFHAFDPLGGVLRPPTKVDFDTETFENEWVQLSVNSCDPTLAADLAAARNAVNVIQGAFRDWQIDYERDRDLRSDDFLKLSAAGVQLAAQVAGIITALAGLNAVIIAESTLTAGQSALLGIIGNTIQSMGTLLNDIQSGSAFSGGWNSAIDHILNTMGSLMTGAGLDTSFGEGWDKATSGWAIGLSFIGAMKTAMVDIQNLQGAVEDGVAKSLATYLEAQDAYLSAVRQYRATLDRLRFYASANCPDPKPPTPPAIPAKPLPQPNIEGRTSDDPNELHGPAGYGSEHAVRERTPLSYVVEFENKPTADLPARQVVVTSKLDPSADLSTFALGSAGFGDHVVTAPPGRSAYSTTIDDSATSGTLVKLDAALNKATRTVTWTYTALDARTGDEPADPSAGFLPPDMTAPEGAGFATYAVSPLASATRVTAQARIVFDANAPIDTNVYANAIDTSAPSSHVLALPATTSAAAFAVSWTGTDDAAGIATYDVFVSTDGGAWTPFVAGTAATSATFSGAVGHTYRFYSVATDGVGHREAANAVSQAQTSVIAPDAVGSPPGPGIVLPSPSPKPTPAAPARFKPRVLVRGASSQLGKYRGKRTFTVTIRNAGALADVLKLRGTGNRPGFAIRYRAGRKDITKLVEKGTYRTAKLKPGAVTTLTLVVTVRSKGKRSGAWTLTATSTGSAAAKSAATVKLKVK